MKLLSRLARLLTPAPPKIRFMCIRCDETKDDVLGPWSWCGECRQVIAQIALEHPDVYLKYVASMKAAKEKRC